MKTKEYIVSFGLGTAAGILTGDGLPVMFTSFSAFLLVVVLFVVGSIMVVQE